MTIISNIKKPLALASVLLFFTTTVQAATPPTANAGADKTVQVNHTITISGNGSDSDGSIVKYQWKRTDDNSVVSNSKSFSITPSGTKTKTFVLTVTDNQGTTASDTMVLNVTKDPIEGGNTPPKANAGADKTVQVNNPITITGSTDDSDGTVVKYQWKRMDTNSIVSNSKSFHITPSGTRAKTFVFTVTDNQGTTASDTMVLTVTEGPVEEGNQVGTTSPTNTPPTADAGPDKIVQVDHTVTILGSGSDSDGSIVKYTWKKQGDDRILSNSESIEFTPSGTRSKIFVFSVTDDEGKTASDTMVLTVTKDSVAGNTSAAVAGKNSPYLEPVNLPECDPYNPEVQFIETNEDWKTINNSSKRIFCIYPGDYKSLKNISLTRSGTATKRRYIILYNGNNLHPGQLDTVRLANYALNIEASYWTIDRMASINSTGKTAVVFKRGKYNILNRAFVDNSNEAVSIRNAADNNTIQKCRFQNPTARSLDKDQAGITTMQWKADSYTIKNTKIIENEIVNYNDGIQLNRSQDSSGGSLYQHVNCEGTIIDGNHIYANDKIASTGENALDFKAGSDNALNPVVVTNNHLWGYKGTRIQGEGTLIVAHYSPKNLHINNNVLFEAGQSIVSGSNGPTSGYTYGMINSEIGNNLIYAMVQKNGNQYTIKLSGQLTTDSHDNVFVNCKSKKGFFSYNKNGNYFRRNTFINSVGTLETSSNGKSVVDNLHTNVDYPDTKAAGYTKNYSFKTDRYTKKSRVITLINAVKPK